MNRQLRRLGVGLLACYLALFAMINYVQVVRARALNNDPENTRRIVRDFDQARGDVVTADGVVLACTVDVTDTGGQDPLAGGPLDCTQPAQRTSQFERQRLYPERDLFGHVSGHFNFGFGATGVEREYNDFLAGRTDEQRFRSLSDLFVERERTADVTLTLRKDVQEVARSALAEATEGAGAVVALDPRDGSILALWSNPAYDPNLLSSNAAGDSQQNKTTLEADPGRPLRGRTWQERFFPGSTFKVVTGSIGVDGEQVTPENPSYPVATQFDPADGRPIQNFGGSSCGGALFQVLRVSCNSAFAEMGAVTIGPESMLAGAEDFGLNDRPPIDLPNAATSVFPDTDSIALTALASIGQGDTSTSPLQMALAASAVANNGIVMRPHVMAEIRDAEGDVIEAYESRAWKQAISGTTADTMRAAMYGVVDNGTATRLDIAGFDVGGKTGTAQLGTDPPSSHAWIIGFAGPPGEQPTVAVAVIVEAQPGVSEITGGRVAAPVARQVMERILEIQSATG
ncbi:MAG: peptidoglycan D,D-transpeptidase FtsI family protein [Acidimicrobiales bacterium]